MGLKYLDNRSWSELTREERFFCQHLFMLIQQRGVREFVEHLNRRHGATLDPAANWEVAYEACFYRDLWYHRGRRGRLFSPKRTFDLCLFSDEAIVVIEAKAQQEFDEEQLRVFDRDKTQLLEETGVSVVLLAGLASSRYKPSPAIREYFNGPYLTWLEMASLYAGDPILERADQVYEPSPGWESGKHNSGGYLTGSELIAAHKRGEEFYVGRGGGLDGAALAEDVASGNWRRQKYETNREATGPPNRNWFRLVDFADQISAQEGHENSP